MKHTAIEKSLKMFNLPGPKPGTEVDPDPTTPEIDPPIPPDAPLPNII